jgi:hypothetical protein
MKRMTFASSVPSHVYTGLHLLERMCHLLLISAQRCLINEEDDFRLVGAHSCVRRSSSSQTDLWPSPRRCPATTCSTPFTNEVLVE